MSRKLDSASGRQPDRNAIAPHKYMSLPLGAIKPRGWLQRQLRIQADGLSGHLPEFWPDLGPDSGWLGGEGESWERGPYYMDGLVPLAFLLEDRRLVESAHRWIGWTLDHQGPDGWIGPSRNTDWWPTGVMTKVLTQYHEATQDPRVIPVLSKFFKLMLNQLDSRPLEKWAIFRWADTAISVIWLYNHTREHSLLELLALLVRQGYDWDRHFTNFEYKSKTTSTFELPTHGVNNAMGLKSPGVMYEITGNPKHLEAAYTALEALDTYHGQATGVFTCDEHYAGRNPSQGTELCTVVEMMFSLERLIALTGDSTLADRLERIAFNALPATFSEDMWSHQYDQQANQVICYITEDRVYTNNRADANIFGLEPNFGCCTANMHQGWPKFVSHLWMATPDGGLAGISYAPCSVTATVRDGSTACLEVETDYPFDETVSIRLQLSRPSRFPIRLRMPDWADAPSVSINGTRHAAKAGDIVDCERTWTNDDSVVVSLPMRMEVQRRYNSAVTVSRGPLVYALQVGEEWRQVRRESPHADYEVRPTTPWNYALLLDPERPGDSLRFEAASVSEIPFSAKEPPGIIAARGRQIPEWGIEHGAAAPPPPNPVSSGAPMEDLTLVPYGCARLRVTEIPTLG